MTPLSSPFAALPAMSLPSRDAGPVAGGRGTWLWPLAIYGLARLVSGYFLVVGGAQQPFLRDSQTMHVDSVIPAAPGYWDALANWDGQWYKSIALHGYPETVPLAGGTPEQNEWVFYPLFPALSRALMEIFQVRFEVAAGLASLAAGGAAIVLLYGYLLRRMSRFSASATVAVLSAFPTAAILQAAYAESLTLLLLIAAIISLSDRRYIAYAVVVLLLGLTRPIAPPLLLVLTVHLWWRFRNDGLRDLRSRAMVVGAIVVTATSMFAWPLVAGIASGNFRIFFESRLAWRLTPADSYLPAGLIPQAFSLRWDLGGVALVLGVVGIFIAIAFGKQARAWGWELRAWALFYPLFLLTMTQPTLSLGRYALLALVPWWPLSHESGAHESRIDVAARWVALAVVLAGFTVAQYFWVTEVFTIDVSPDSQGFP